MKLQLLTFPIIAAALCLNASADTIVYSNDFTVGAGSEWSAATVSTTPGTVSHAADQFLGEFGKGVQTFTLNNLDPHSNVTLTFDLYVIRSMDGNGEYGNGPDNWYVGLPSSGVTLLSTNFANYPGDSQSYPGNVAPLGAGMNNASGTGATEINSLGYTYGSAPMDSVYHITETFASSDSTLGISFQSSQSEDIFNESWGLDNVVVSTDAAAAPEPATFAILGTGLAMLGLMRRRSR